MPVAVSYPGVYVQEIPSGVRTIVGVGTSIGMFLGRTRMGELKKAVQCLSYEDFVRNFDSSPDSQVADAVKLFFSNGGTQCYVMRIANGAKPAAVTLKNEAGVDTLDVTARSAGTFGDDIRLSVSYNTLEPESTFNLEVFRWVKNSSGALVKTGIENYLALSMDPAHPRYAPDIVSQSSALVTLTDKAVPAAAQGMSISGFAVSARTQTIFRTQWMALVGAASARNKFNIGVDGNAPVPVDLSSLDFGAAPDPILNPQPLDTPANAFGNLALRIQALINNALASTGASVTVDMVTGPSGPTTPPPGHDNTATVWLRIRSANGDVKIEPASNAAEDLASSLMLGTAQGGLEISRNSVRRPAPNGYVFNPADLKAFAELRQDAFDGLQVNLPANVVDLSATGPNKIVTTTSAGVTQPRLYQDQSATNQNNGRDGVREKLGIIAAAIVSKRAADPTFGWTAEVWGTRLAILPVAGQDTMQTTVAATIGGAAGPALGAAPIRNVRYYNLGATIGAPPFHGSGVAGVPGIEPQPNDYADAYAVIDKDVDLFNILVLPRDVKQNDAARRKLWGPASTFCLKRRAFLLIDPPDAWTNSQVATSVSTGVNTLRVGLVKDYSAVFYPKLKVDDNGKEKIVDPSGAIAGVMARIDSTRGVWKAAAGTEADLRGVIGVEQRFSDGENGVLNPNAVNTIRVFPNGIVSWGARTMDGADAFGSEYKYIPIRRLALYIEESLYRGLKWAVFEPNDEPLWGQIRLNVGAFMHNLFRQGAFQGATPREAYFVKCDKDTTTQNDRNLGIVNIVVGFAPLKPAEFVVLYLQQMAGQIQV
ncbi:MAG: phage tail sheath subtilisin-like domain-containing protein [Burkholderiales bacterium]